MMRSLFSGVSGLRVHQTKMDVIANNIANVNTVGFKSSRVTFNDVFYQRIQGAAGPNAETGRAGTNAMQIGLGAGVASIDNVMTQGAAQRTDNAMDVMIQGNGFFVVSDGSGVYFTRAGNIGKDLQNNLHINGMQLMGWDVQEVDGVYEVQKGPVKPISLSGTKEYMKPESTTLIDIMGNLNALEDPIVNRTMEFYDSVGNLYTADVKFKYHPGIDMTAELANGDPRYTSDGIEITDEQTGKVVGYEPISDHQSSYWDFEFLSNDEGLVLVYPDNDRTKPKTVALNVGDLTDDVDLTSGAAALNTKGILQFDTNGILQGYAAFSTDPSAAAVDSPEELKKGTPPRLNIMLAPVNVLDPTATFGEPSGDTITYGSAIDMPIGSISLDFSKFTQFEGEHTNAKCLYTNGNAPGTLEDISVGPDGRITGRYTNGRTRVLAQIPVAKFANPAGLEKVGNNLYATTPNSGQFDGTGEIGDIMGGVLEMSNVDLSQEFTEMITTQRGFQANSRIISVSDELLQELVNLKR